MYAIETRELTKIYGARTAVDSLTVRIARGEVFGFLGPNGAGKTTAVKMLLGLVRPSSGHAALLGSPLGSLDARRKIGYLPELFRYQEWLTPHEILHWHAAVLRLHAAKWRDAIEEVLRRVGLAERGNDRVGQFSKGMQQRLGLAVAILGEPELVILDEPTSALDPLGRADVRALVQELKSRGTTVFLNSHLLTEVESVCDSVAVITGGCIRATGPIDRLLGRPGVRVTFANGTSVVEDVPNDEIPALVASYVAKGAAIVSVVPIRQTLEERFLEIVRSEPLAQPVVDRITHAS
ncbi:MAG TPA: ABC transporter ATP-binding protein [Candidatus Aquilonibacter sp.]|nr:ABC transporter ATP-binding protein [Candidatus Aquilonibacter sp.]